MSQPASADRVATTIGLAKWLLVAVLGLFGTLAFIGFLMTAASGESPVVPFGICVVCAVYAIGVWVLFGWFEHTLRLLSAIATNTRPLPSPSVRP